LWDGALVHVERAQVHVDRALVHVDRAQVHVDRALVHVDRALVHVDRALVHVDRALVHVERAQVHVDRALVHVDVFQAGAVACYPDVLFGRRRLHTENMAELSGRLAGFNMAGEGREYKELSFNWY